MCCLNDIRNATTKENLFSKLVYVNKDSASVLCEKNANRLGGSHIRSLFSRCLQWASLRHNTSLPLWVGFPSQDMLGILAGIPKCL